MKAAGGDASAAALRLTDDATAMTRWDGHGISAPGGPAPPIKPKLCRIEGC
jgi:hypothetical protein